MQRGRFGKYLPIMQTAVDYVMVNAIFAILVLLYSNSGEINFYGRLRLIWVVMNASFLPIAIYFRYVHASRTMRIERLLPSSLKGIVAFAIVNSALDSFLAVTGIPGKFFLQLYLILVIAIPLVWLAEYFVIRSIRRRGHNYSNVLIIGVGETGRRIYKNLRSSDGFGLNIRGFVGASDPGELPAPYLGDISNLDKIVKDNHIHTIYLASYGDNERVIQQVIRVADDNICKFYYVPSLSHFVKRNFYLSSINNSMPALGLHPNPLQNPVNQLLKRGFDMSFSLVVLTLLVPLVFVPVGIAVKLSSPGPVFFKQKRTGYRGREFYCWKFRTMKVNDAADSRQATKDDDRKTRLGNFLRHTSIDELPQFINVLMGDMSVVGPRPHMLSHTETYRQLISQYMVRHLIKPGITGWAQIQGFRGTTDELWKMEKRVDNDVWYIEHWSFLLDLKIIVKTVSNAVAGEENAF